MPIEINGHGVPPSVLRNAEGGASVRPSAQPPPEQERTPDSPDDSVSLTADSARLHTLQKVVEQLPAEDSRRVEAVRQALSDGSYRIDPQRVADKMLQFEHLLKNTV